MIMSQVLHAGEIPAHDHGLAEVAKRELGIEMDKSCQNSDWGSSELTAQQLEYAATDARILPALYKKLRGEEVGQ
jgi:ribonuclease D